MDSLENSSGMKSGVTRDGDVASTEPSEKRGSEYVFHESKKHFYELRKPKLPSISNIDNIICNNIFYKPILPPIMGSMNYMNYMISSPPTTSIFIQKLPQDILKYIYDSHFDIKHTFDVMITVFNSTKCANLYPQELLPYVTELFTNKLLLMYTLKHIHKESIAGYSFMNVYNDFNKKGAKCNFPLIDDKFLRFTLAWLYSAYH